MKSTTLFADILLSITTLPLLAGVVGIKLIDDALQGVGRASEDIFRGDRLPILEKSPFPDASNANESSS